MKEWHKILLKEIFRRFWHDRCLTHAQALTYNTVFALVPLLAFMLSIIRLFIGTEDLITEINEGLSKFLNPGTLSKVQETILNLINRAQTAPLGAASMIIFLAMVIGLLMQFEEVLNQIFRIKNHRTVVQRITVYWMGLTLGPILVALPLGITIYFTHLGLKGRDILSSFSRFWTLFFITLLFLGVFLYLPAKRIRVIPAIVGAVLAGVLWFFVANIYAFYTSKAVAYSKLYGSLSAIPFFLLWLFMNWSVVLFGAEITGVFNQKELILAHYLYPRDQAISLVGLAVLLEIYRRHHEGLPGPNEAHLVKILKVSPLELEDIINRLKDATFIFEFEDCFFPSKDPSKVYLSRVYESVIGRLPKEPPSEPSVKIAYEFLKTHSRAWSEYTLKDLLDRIYSRAS